VDSPCTTARSRSSGLIAAPLKSSVVSQIFRQQRVHSVQKNLVARTFVGLRRTLVPARTAPQRMSRSDFWRQRYIERPYLTGSSNQELDNRFFEVLNNSLVLAPSGKIAPVPPHDGGGYWLEAFTHLVQEYRRRGRDFPHWLPGLPIPKPTFPAGAPGNTATFGRQLKIAGALYKFGKEQHLRELLNHGRLRIQPASNYNDPSLNHAIRDDELSISRVLLKSESQMEVVHSKSGFKGPIEPLGDITVSTRSTTNYFASCFAAQFASRLYDDFEADACLYIRSRAQFKQRLWKATLSRLCGWNFRGGRVGYIDPHRAGPYVDVFFNKAQKYWYQHEFRFVWIPPQDAAELDPIFVELGPLIDIAELLPR
jgi:hypothetical protein